MSLKSPRIWFNLFIVAVGFVPSLTSAQVLVQPVIGDRLRPAQEARLTGYVGQQLDASYENRILAQDATRLVEPFRHRTEERCWQSEFWGKWFTSAVQAYQYRPEPKLKAVLDKAVADLLTTQTPDGYIGNYSDAKRLEQWDIWGRKYCMLGLLAYYDLTKDQKSLQATRKEADFLMQELQTKQVQIVQKGNHKGMAATSILEPMVLLYARTKDPKYLAFANEIVQQWESADGPQLIAKAGSAVGERFPVPQKNWFGYEQGQKAYEMMSCYEGLLELYRLTGKPAYRTAVEQTWTSIRDTEINVAGSGSSIECWFGGRKVQALPAKRYQETCVTATWIKLSQQLLRLTGEARYAEAIEQSFYNALLGSMRPGGATWAKYSPLVGTRTQGEDQCEMGLNCCIASGPRGLFTLPLTTVMSGKDALTVNFFAAGSYRVKTPKGQVAELKQQTDYPASGTISMVLNLPKPETMALRVRIPAWSGQTTLTVNGQAVAGVMPGEYATISRVWQPTDTVTLTLDMRGRVERTGTKPAEYVAILRGPMLLARDSRIAGLTDVDEIISPALDKDGFLPLEHTGTDQNGIWMRFNAPFLIGTYRSGEYLKPVSLPLCDYVSAGNTYDGTSRFRVWFQQLVDPAGPGTVPVQAKPNK
ncbi:glycoside hydrolase family 127 protein [Spirosoma arcticum]